MNSRTPSILQVGDVLLSSDLVTEPFCCDLDTCKGICCIEGDAGAPLTPDEVDALNAVLPALYDKLPAKAQAVIHQQGVAYKDRDGDDVTSIIEGRDCVFARLGDNSQCCACILEQQFLAGRLPFRKPISCFLYPIREKRLGDVTALNYHRWEVCKPARLKGQREGIAVYQFLRQPLISRFGDKWFAELEATVEALRQQGLL